jgi:hypothetical protein
VQSGVAASRRRAYEIATIVGVAGWVKSVRRWEKPALRRRGVAVVESLSRAVEHIDIYIYK